MTLAARRERRKAGTGASPAILLAWYDRHRRRLPWRAPPGETPDPYRVWLSEIMLQQTTVRTVAPYYARFLERWPSVKALAASPLAEVLKTWAGLGYYARARNLHACARAVVERHGGCFPGDLTALAALPGVGPYTAAAIAAIAFGKRATPVDGNVERVVARLFAVEAPLPGAKPDIRRLAEGLTPDERPGDFAQALMDLGAMICTPLRPSCALCPWNDACAAFRLGVPETFPRKAPKSEGRLRRGAAFWIERADGAVLVRTRPLRGLLGGMTEVPTSEWSHDFDAARALHTAPRVANGRTKLAWRKLPGKVTHVFTHFPLELIVYAAAVPAGARAPRGMRFVRRAALGDEAWPTLMRKVIALADDRGRMTEVRRPQSLV
ncbi:MAG TPA: A/G-specific adenine glycosylase [Xanthobacteraceae bacterium]|jgi:A/G-specific adenine glycosylase|nr:A/G-specific adenine glycosylase [Xanthobacteraceae bacterium]